MSRAAIRYAKALLELTNLNNTSDVVNNDMMLISETLNNSQELKDFLNNPTIGKALKKQTLTQVFSSVQKETSSLFSTLETNARFELLDAISKLYSQLLDEQKGIVTATVTTAIPLDASLETQIIAKAKEMTPHQVRLVNKIDQDILGGFILRVGDQQLNASLANKLKQIKREFI